VIRHRLCGRVEPRGITPRRLAAARRALRREQDRYALFRDEVAAEQPTPEDRIEQADIDLIRYDQGHRDLAALHWRKGRRMLASVDPTVREEILTRWNNHRWLPADAGYFVDFVWTELLRRGLIKKGDYA